MQKSPLSVLPATFVEVVNFRLRERFLPGCDILYSDDAQHGRGFGDGMIVNPFL